VVNNQPPNAIDDLTNTNQNQPITFNITNNDIDVDGRITGVDLNPNEPNIQNTVTTAEGTFSVDVSGNLTFTPVSGFVGTANLPYKAFDDDGGADTATISIVVNNQPPNAIDDLTNTNQNQPITFNITNNDIDVDGRITGVDLNPNEPNIQNTITTPQGTFSVDVSGNLTFTPVSEFTGQITLPYTIIDNDGDTGTANIVITVEEILEPPVNKPPIANEDTTVTGQNEPVTLNITANDSDPDGNIIGIDLDPNTSEIQNTITTPQGTFSVDVSGNLTFTPVSEFTGQVTLPYTIIDNDGDTGTANIVITVEEILEPPVNEPPIANEDTTVTGQNEPVTLNITANDNDPDGSITGIDLNPNTPDIENIVTTPQGIFSVDPSGNLTFTPASDFTGTATLPYTIFDNSGETDTANISIVVTEEPPIIEPEPEIPGEPEPEINKPPVANNDITTSIGNQPVTLNILNNDSDSDGSITAIDLDPNTPGLQNTYSDGQGIFSVDNDGNLIFTPNSTFTGVATLSYQVIDDDGQSSNPANVNITVVEIPEPPIVEPEPEIPVQPEPEINKPPVANDDNTITTGDQPVTLNILVNDNDPDGSITAVDLDPNTPGIQNQVTTPQGTFSLDNNGNLVFNPTSGFTGVATLPYQIFDNDGATDQAVIRINVNPEDVPEQPEVECDCRCPEKPVLDWQPDLKPAPAIFIPSPNPFDVNTIGTENNDNLFGTNANEQFLAENGDDVIDGEAGNDNIFGGFGNDLIRGGFGNDYLNGKEDNDTIYGGDDNDFIHGGKQNDLVYGELGNDTIIGEQGEDTLWGGTYDNLDESGEDLISGGEGNDLIYGNQANDTLIGDNGDDWLRAGKGNDLMYGESGSDTLMGELGNDTLIGDPDLSPTATGFGADALYGEEGDDILVGGRLNDTLLGGKDNDWIYGGKDNDWIKGELGNDTLFGQQGDDTLLGGNNDATVLDLEGKDLLFGAGGNDMINGFYANDTLMGGKDEDHLFGGKGDDIIFGELGNDLSIGDNGNDTICAGDGDDTLYGDNVGVSEAVGANGQQDKLGGGAGNDIIFGNEGQDMLCGDEGNDTLRGGKDNDMLCGGAGDDWLMGEAGDDTIMSGEGNDLIQLALEHGLDLIVDMDLQSDRLVLPDGVSFNDLTFSQSANGTLISYQGQNIALLNNINPDNLSANIFQSNS
jgi:CshA-type fibril repeat protein